MLAGPPLLGLFGVVCGGGFGLKPFKKGLDYPVDVEVLKKALRELVEREPTFFRDLFLETLRSDGRAAEALLELFTKHPEARLKLAQVVAGSIAVPLNVATKDDIKAAVEELKRWAEEEFVTKEDLKQFATKEDLKQLVTKEDLKQFATKEDIKRLEDKMATKEDLKQFATKEDLKQFATKQDLERFVTKEYFDAVIKRLEDKMATKEQIESITISVEDSGREMVQFSLSRGATNARRSGCV
jgi:hypothetical protein